MVLADVLIDECYKIKSNGALKESSIAEIGQWVPLWVERVYQSIANVSKAIRQYNMITHQKMVLSSFQVDKL